jgi:hypothetical protein
MSKEILMAHIDYENIRWRFRDYVEFITLERLIEAFQSIGEEIGELRQVFFYGDWTRRPQDARKIEELGCRAINVLSKIRGSDRSDPTMMFAIDDQSKQKEITAFLLGAGDADYKEVILRCRERGKSIYAVCFGRSASRELFTMTEGVYPLEVRLGLKEKQQTLPTFELIDEQSKTKHFIQRIDNLEKALDYVVRNYVRDKILLPTKLFGETREEVDNYLNNELKKSYLKEWSMDNPKLLGKQVICFKLERENPLVIESLTATNEEAKP